MPEIESEVKVSTESSESVVGFVHSTPAVRRLAKEHAIDIRLITGTGKDQRVTKEDVLLHLSRPSTSSTHTSAPAPVSSLNPPAIAPVSPISSGTVRVPFNAVRQAMFRSMSNALKIPHFGYSEQIDVTELERVRLELNSTSEDGRRLTLFSLLIKAMGYALRSEPIFRSTLAEPFCFVQRQTVDISIALSSPQGLLTPLVPNVGQKTVFEIADHVRRLREFVESLPDSDRLPVFPEELGGNRPGTFTLSNIGVIGGSWVTLPQIFIAHRRISRGGREMSSELTQHTYTSWQLTPFRWYLPRVNWRLEPSERYKLCQVIDRRTWVRREQWHKDWAVANHLYLSLDWCYAQASRLIIERWKELN